MQRLTLKIDGMMCGMCEAHINDAIRRAVPVKKVKSSHAKGLTEILTETDVSDEKLRAAIDDTGYTLVSVSRQPYVKRSLFHTQ